jgi:hypothetical protein
MTNKILVRLVLVSATLSTLTLAAWLAKPSALHLATQAEAAEMSQDEFERRVHDYLLAHPEVVAKPFTACKRNRMRRMRQLAEPY